MGYDLYITRARRWTESDSHPIPAETWLEVIRSDSSLQIMPDNGPYFATWTATGEPREWLDWFQGHIYSKSPSPALIDKMVEIAGRLGARVVGEEDETYVAGARPAVPYQPTAGERLRYWLRKIFPPSPLSPAPALFQVGDRVRDVWGQRGVVILVDPKAEHGLGIVKTRYDDGREVSWSLRANPLTKE